MGGRRIATYCHIWDIRAEAARRRLTVAGSFCNHYCTDSTVMPIASETRQPATERSQKLSVILDDDLGEQEVLREYALSTKNGCHGASAC